MGRRMVKLGGSALEVPIVCMGTMTMGEQNNEQESFELLDYCMTRGVNFIDTAELYPVPPSKETAVATEVILGNWIESRQNRDKIILASKVSGPTPGLDRSFIVNHRTDPPANGDKNPELNYDEIIAACDGSLRRLKTSYLDLYQIHWPSRYAPTFGNRQYKLENEHASFVSFEEQVRAMGDLIKAGKINHWGLSNETSYGTMQFCEVAKRMGVPPPITIQNDFSLVDRSFDNELAEVCAPSHYNVSLLCYGPLAGGTLSGKYCKGQPPASGRHTLFPKFQPRYFCPRTMAATEEYVALAKQKGISPTHLALAWAAGRWYMGSVIIGATNMAQLKECIDGCEMELDEETLKQIDAIHVRMRNPNCHD